MKTQSQLLHQPPETKTPTPTLTEGDYWYVDFIGDGSYLTAVKIFSIDGIVAELITYDPADTRLVQIDKITWVQKANRDD